MPMQVPLEIRYPQFEGSEALEGEIRRHVDKLNRIYERLIACRISIELPHRQHKTGNVPEVHIEMSVPGGKPLVVSREPHKAQQRHARPDVRTALRDAFKAAEKQLKSFKTAQHGEVKAHAAPFQGKVTGLVPEEDHGFLETATGAELYFSRTSVLDGFDSLKVGETVHYEQIDGDSGPVANKVWRGPAHHMD
jgi:cold shock CspA family protein/ribosome-associated translation inhibitor RaiA